MITTIAQFWQHIDSELNTLARDIPRGLDPSMHERALVARVALVREEVMRAVASLGAERMRMFEALTFLVGYLKKNGGYMFGEDQEVLRGIERELAGVMP